MNETPNKMAIQLDVLEGSVGEQALQRELFPTSAFEFDDAQKDATPDLTLKSPWRLVVEGLFTATGGFTITGISTFAKTLLDDADVSAAQSTLGISTFIKTLLDDADAAAARATLDAPSWDKITNPGTGWLASKTTAWTTDQFVPGGLTVDFSSTVPVGTRAVCITAFAYMTTVNIFWRAGGDTNISNTPEASNEKSARLFYGSGLPSLMIPVVVWLSATYTVDFAMIWASGNDDFYISYPIAYLL